MKPDKMIEDVLELMNLVIKGEAIKNQKKGFLAYLMCSKIAKKLVDVHDGSGQWDRKCGSMQLSVKR